MLVANRTLRELQLDNNEIGDPGAIAIAESLEPNQVLQQLWLPENPITEAAIMKFAEYLEVNTGIQNLGLSFNGGPDSACVEALRRAKRKRLERQRVQRRPDDWSVPAPAKMSSRSAAQGDEAAGSPRSSRLSSRSAFDAAIGSARGAAAEAGAGAFLGLDQMPADVSEAVIGEIHELEADLNNRLLVWELPQQSARTPRSSRAFAPAVTEGDSDSSGAPKVEEGDSDSSGGGDIQGCAGVFVDSDSDGGN
ncbi:unnamed protein product [Prorocentrum cordatum]|uniref:Uncharacterized protein n=1 Tax=Prorocentrum cordatum TaxID=2364126 RepID=A0ABN9XU02_9DINO|nr:unnamed protein product [Polarella glacialis]